MSQRVWTCTSCGWCSTAENVERKHSGVGRGEAPPHCRRCGGAALRMTTATHPKITLVCKNQKCRADFIGWPGAKYCDKCRPVFRGQKVWEGRRKWVWTPERDQILRDDYKSNPTDIAKRFGWPKWVVSHRAQALGLCRTKEKPWTRADDAFLLKWAGVHTPNWMRQQLRQRTITAIIVRLKRLNVSRRIQADGLTMGQLEQALGVDHRMIAGWWRSGRLKGVRRDTDRLPQQGGDPYVFREEDIATFLIDNPLSFRLDRVDQAWFMGLMRLQQTDVVDAQQPKTPHARVAKRASTVRAADVMPCAGIDDDTPCPHDKSVIAQPGIPPRCPDCKMELRRRLQLETAARKKTRPPFEWDDEPVRRAARS